MVLSFCTLVYPQFMRSNALCLAYNAYKCIFLLIYQSYKEFGLAANSMAEYPLRPDETETQCVDPEFCRILVLLSVADEFGGN